MNCGYGIGYSVLEVIKEFEKFTKRKFKINIKPKRVGDISKIYSNINKVRKILNTNFKFKSIKDIVKSSIEWEKKCKTLN